MWSFFYAISHSILKIIFVYNANSGLLNSTFDALHKVVSPKTYQCNLCSLTHGAFTEKEEWSKFVEQSNHSFEFLYKDDFEERFNQKFSYPCVLSQNETMLELLIDSDSLNSLNNLEDLINEIKNIKA